MTILSLKFLEFVIITLVIYYLLPGKFQNSFLLLASYYFYYTQGPYLPLLLIISALTNFGLGHWLHKSARFKKWILWLGIAFNIAILAWFMFGGPYLANLNIPVATKYQLLPLIIVPVGISYYTLNNISYLIDINLRIAKPTTNLVDYALYLAYFPKIISGPLERARKFLPLLAEKRTVDNQVILQSVTLILIGLVRASIIGGMLALFVPAKPLNDPASYGNPALLWGMITFMFYLYNQFAGYTDIVRGVSGLFGIPLSRNFNQPFFSKDFSDFWLRWHISLSQWLRDYIYMPLSRAFLRRNPSRTNIPNLIIPPLVTMLVSGFWHVINKSGMLPSLLTWGLFMGLLIVFENIRMLFRPAVPTKSISLWRRLLSSAGIVIIMLLATAPFVLTLKGSLVYYRQIIFGWDWQMIDLRPVAVLILSFVVDWFQYRSNDELVFMKWPAWLQTILIVSITMGAIIIQQLQSAPPMFIYP